MKYVNCEMFCYKNRLTIEKKVVFKYENTSFFNFMKALRLNDRSQNASNLKQTIFENTREFHLIMNKKKIMLLGQIIKQFPNIDFTHAVFRKKIGIVILYHNIIISFL